MKANQIVSIKFVDTQLLDFMNFFSGDTSLESFLETYQNNETTVFFRYEWFDCKEVVKNKKFPPFDSFFSILRKNKTLENDNIGFENRPKSGSSK